MTRDRDRERITAPPEQTPATNDRPGSLALVFPGQGSQHAGMGKDIAEVSPAARATFDAADEALGFSISERCFAGSAEDLRDTINTQPAVLTTSLAYLAYLRELAENDGTELRPALMAGHSLGQFTAAVAANALDLSAGVRLALERGRVMADWASKHPGGLATVLGLDDEAVAKVCLDASLDGKVGVAVLNGPGQCVISGETEALEQAMALAKERGGRVLLLPISTPGHTPRMAEAATELSTFISALTFRAPDPPLVSNISAKLLTTAAEVRTELADQICAPVVWERCVLTMADRGVTSFVEVGPGHALSKLVRRITRAIDASDVENSDSEALLKIIRADAPRVPTGSAAGKP